MKVKEDSEKAGLKLNIQKTKIIASVPITSWQIGGETMEAVTNFIFLDSKITADGDCSHGIKRCLLLGRKAMTYLDRIWKGRDITLSTKVHIVNAMVFPVVMYGCERWTSHKEGWAPKNWCFWTMVKTLETPLDYMEIKPVNPKGNQSWVFIRTDAETEAPILWRRDAKSWLTRKDPDARKYWKQEEKGTAEDEMVGWHHQLSGRDFEQALGDDEGGEAWSAAVPGVSESDTSEWLNNNFLNNIYNFKSPEYFSIFLGWA